jgi:hypothetical protein
MVIVLVVIGEYYIMDILLIINTIILMDIGIDGYWWLLMLLY